MRTSQKSSRFSRKSSSRIVAAETPEAKSPPTSAPAEEPERREGKRPASSSTVITPACAKKPKKPEDKPAAKGRSASHSLRVGEACVVAFVMSKRRHPTAFHEAGTVIFARR